MPFILCQSHGVVAIWLATKPAVYDEALCWVLGGLRIVRMTSWNMRTGVAIHIVIEPGFGDVCEAIPRMRGPSISCLNGMLDFRRLAVAPNTEKALMRGSGRDEKGLATIDQPLIQLQ